MRLIMAEQRIMYGDEAERLGNAAAPPSLLGEDLKKKNGAPHFMMI